MRSWDSESSISYGVRSRLAKRNAVEIRGGCRRLPRAAISTDELVRPGGAHVLDRDHVVVAEHLEAGLDQQFSVNGSPTCTVGFICSDSSLNSARREQARAVDAVAAGLRADVENRIAGARWHRAEDAVGASRCRA